MKPEEALTMEKLLNELQSVDTVKLVLTGCGESIYGSREVYEAIRPFVDKQVPKKVKNIRLSRDLELADHNIKEGECPECGETMTGNTFGYYCGCCGVTLDWGNEE